MTQQEPDPVAGVAAAAGRRSWSDLAADVFGLRQRKAAGSVAAVRSDDALVIAAALAALDGWASEVHLVPGDVDVSVAGADAFLLDDAVCQRDVVSSQTLTDTTAASVTERSTSWVVYTSGTSGTPKAIRHTLQSLSRTISTTTASVLRWGLLYDPNRMAGLQVLLQARASGAALMAPPLAGSLADRVRQMIDAEVTALSATPTIWRQVLQMPEAREWQLRQITLGGEIADRQVLTALSSAFPDARVVHVFASTETGAAFSVRDGLAGFPASYLSEPPRGVELQIRDGILHVHAPGVSAAGPDGFASTGDRVEVEGDRVLFRGRETGVVNIGGSNVWPEEVENLLRSHPDVAEASVSATPNALAGHLLKASVVLRPDAEHDRAGRRLRSFVRDHAPSSHVPATVTIVDSLGMSVAGKLQR